MSHPRDLEAFRHAFDETLPAFLNLDTWRPAPDPAVEYRRIEEQVQAAVEAETDYQTYIRREVHPLLTTATDAPPGAGVHSVPLRELLEVQRGLLFNGAVEACDGTHQAHDTLALTIHQIGVSLAFLVAGDNGHACRLHEAAGSGLGAEGAHGVAAGADKGEAGGGHGIGKGRIFGEKAVARMDGFAAVLQRNLDDLVPAQVGLGGGRRPDQRGGVGQRHMQAVGVGLRIDRHRTNPHLLAGADDADGNLAAVGNQELGKHGLNCLFD